VIFFWPFLLNKVWYAIDACYLLFCSLLQHLDYYSCEENI
jgi:hypothetical protein